MIVRIALLFVAALRWVQDTAQCVWNLPADLRAFRRFQDGLQQEASIYMAGNFHGPNHEEAYSVFDIGAYMWGRSV